MGDVSSNGLQRNSNGLEPNSDGLQPNSFWSEVLSMMTR